MVNNCKCNSRLLSGAGRCLKCGGMKWTGYMYSAGGSVHSLQDVTFTVSFDSDSFENEHCTEPTPVESPAPAETPDEPTESDVTQWWETSE